MTPTPNLRAAAERIWDCFSLHDNTDPEPNRAHRLESILREVIEEARKDERELVIKAGGVIAKQVYEKARAEAYAQAKKEQKTECESFHANNEDIRFLTIDECAKIAEINDGRTPGSEAEIEAMNIAVHIRALKP